MEIEKKDNTVASYTFKDFLPLIVILSLITLLTAIHQLYYGWNGNDAMRIFMASFFLVFGFFKVTNINEFAAAYTTYDLIAKQYIWYAYLYPFLEIGLGIAYLMKLNLLVTNVLTLIIMLVSAAGVFNELRKGKHVICACLGTVFKIPMTYVTLGEDLLMAFMALLMLIR